VYNLRNTWQTKGIVKFTENLLEEPEVDFLKKGANFGQDFALKKELLKI